MANIKTYTLNPNIEFQNVATITGITFESGKTYQIQVRGDIYLCESASQPEDRKDEGFRIVNDTWSFDCTGDPLWFRNYSQSQDVVINIAD